MYKTEKIKHLHNIFVGGGLIDKDKNCRRQTEMCCALNGKIMPNIEKQIVSGEQIAAIIPELAKLRIAVFKDFPYLYEGSLEYEESYLQKYIHSKDAAIVSVRSAGLLVGASTCIPLADESEEVKKPFLGFSLPIESIFYFGESVLLPEYRGMGLSHYFFDQREQHAKNLGTYQMCCFCAVNRTEDHPMRPAHYRPLDSFWEKRGFVKNSSLVFDMSWPDVGEEISTVKQLTFWTKHIDFGI